MLFRMESTSMRSNNCFSLRIEYSACSNNAFNRISGGIPGRPNFG